MAEATLTADGISLARAGRPVLVDVSLRAAAGRVLVLGGPSGSGKTSLLRCLNGLTWPDTGTVRLDGEDIRELPAPALRRRVALVAQTPVMLPGTVAENLAYGLEGLPDAELHDAAEAAALPVALLDRAADELSGGERLRVGLARALTRAPDAILLDEPTSALDDDTADVVARTIRALAERHLAVVVATHDHALITAVSDDELRLDGGRVVP
ncbi:MAG: ABC transporter ATP-binding protein [Solirubrobacteraceae bacterium]|nr:ABC transporter ATP-binding protein [Solirubrobacteraceae bacterium]